MSAKTFPIQMLQEGGAVKGPKELAGLYDPSPYKPMGMKITPTLQHGNPSDSVTAEFDGITYVIPTVSDGEHLNNKEAIQRFRSTHEHYGGFENLHYATDFQDQFGKGMQEGGEIAGGNKNGLQPFAGTRLPPFHTLPQTDPNLAQRGMPGSRIPPGVFQRRPLPPTQSQSMFAPGYQSGGEVNTDSVHIMATPGEHMMNLGAVAIAGRPFLNALNQMGKSHPAMGGRSSTFPVRTGPHPEYLRAQQMHFTHLAARQRQQEQLAMAREPRQQRQVRG